MKSLMLILAVGLAASDRLDRTYLPPPGSKYSGGSPGDLQVPLEYPKETYTTVTPVKPGSITNPITSEDTRLIPGIERFPGPINNIGSVSSANRPFNYNVPTTTTSYAFTQTTTFPPIEGFETTISPVAQEIPFDGSLRPQQGIVNEPFNQNQNYPQTSSQAYPNLIQPGSQLIQLPGIIPPGLSIPGSQTTTSAGKSITDQPGYNQVQNQYQQNIPSSTVSPTTITQPGTTPYSQGYTQHLGVQPPRQFIHPGNSDSPITFPEYSSNFPKYQNTSFFRETIPSEISQQLGQQPGQIQGQRPVPPSQYGRVQPTAVPSTTTFQQPLQYQGPQFGTQNDLPTTPAPYNGYIYSTPSVPTPGSQSSQPVTQNKLGISQGPYPITGIQEIPGSTITQQQSQVPQYSFQQGRFPSISLPQSTNVYDASSQMPVTGQEIYSPTKTQQGSDATVSISSQKINQPFTGQRAPLPGTQQGLVQQQGVQLPIGGQQEYYSTTDATQKPMYRPGSVQPQGQSQLNGYQQLNGQQSFPILNLRPGQQNQYDNQQDIYPASISQGTSSFSELLTKQPQTIGQQVLQGSSSNFQHGSTQLGDKTHVTNSATNVLQGEYPINQQQTPFIKPDDQQNLKPYGQQQFGENGMKISQEFTAPRPGTPNIPSFTGSSTLGYGQKNIPNTTPTSSSYSTAQESFKPLSTPSYSNIQGSMSTFTMQPRPIRPQDETVRNAEILNYHNVITPEGYSYSFDTSNGIHADENGTTVDGTRANGSYSYIGDDGKLYKIEYSADENGFLPRGDHIPTPPPVPEAIQRVVEQAEKDRAAGISHDGSYDHSKYGPKRYQKYKHRKPEIENNFYVQPERNQLLKNNYGFLDDFDKYDTNYDVIKDSLKTTLKPQSIITSGQTYSGITNDNKAHSKASQKASSTGLESNKRKPINTSTEYALSRRPEIAGKTEKQKNKYQPRPQDDDYDFLTKDDFDQITILENVQNRGPTTSKYKYLPERPPSITSNYDKTIISKENISNGDDNQQQYLGKRPAIFTKLLEERRPVTTDKHDKTSYDENDHIDNEKTQLKKPVKSLSRKPQVTFIRNTTSNHETDYENEKEVSYDQRNHLAPGKRPAEKTQPDKQSSYTEYGENNYDDSNQEDGLEIYRKPQGIRRPSVFNTAVSSGSDTDKFDDQSIRPRKPSKALSKRPQHFRRPSTTESYFEDFDDEMYTKDVQNRRPEKPMQSSSTLGVNYNVRDSTDKFNPDLGISKDKISVFSKKPTSTRKPGYEDIRNEQQRPSIISRDEGVENGSYSSEMRQQIYKQDFENRQQDIDKFTGYHYTHPQNAFEQVKNKFPSRFSEKVQGVTRKPASKYDITDKKTTVQPFITPNVSRNDDEGLEDSSEEKLSFKIPGQKTPQKLTSSYEDYGTTNSSQEDLDIGDEEITNFQPGQPGKVGTTRRPQYIISGEPEYSSESVANNDEYLRKEGSAKQIGERKPGAVVQSTKPEYTNVSSRAQAPRQMFRPGNKQPSNFDEEGEDELQYSTTSSPYGTTEMEENYTVDTTAMELSTLATKKPSRTGSYSEITETQAVTIPGSSKKPSKMSTSQTLYDYTDGTIFPGSPNIRPGLSESVFTRPSPGRPPKPSYYSTKGPALENTVPGTINQTEAQPGRYYQVTAPTYKPQGNNYPNSGLMSTTPGSRYSGRPGLQDLPSTTYRPNYSVTDITRPTIDAFGRPIFGDATPSEYITPGQSVPSTEASALYHDTGVIRPGQPSSFNAGESRFGVTSSAPGPKPAEFGPSSITTPGYLVPKSPTDKVTGEVFSGPKQPQRFDPNTGYHY